jgi:hypothetical protein
MDSRSALMLYWLTSNQAETGGATTFLRLDALPIPTPEPDACAR